MFRRITQFAGFSKQNYYEKIYKKKNQRNIKITKYDRKGGWCDEENKCIKLKSKYLFFKMVKEPPGPCAVKRLVTCIDSDCK